MNIFSDITKSTLENLIKNLFLKFGNIKACHLIDSIKILGFFYATAGGISISMEDLNTSSGIENILSFVKSQSALKTLEWQEGKISDIERYQTILNNWNLATEYIKIEILSFYKKFDPLNCLYLMSNSGARGNMSQVRQLIGLRGLMLDQKGTVIDTPIDTSFSKGLTAIDYLISAYGARKGIVDTAIKTADAGYLTRRLIFLAQNIAIRNIDCNTNYNNTIIFTKKTNESIVIGRYLINIKDQFYNKLEIFEKFENSLITKDLVNLLKSYNTNFYLTIRTILNCNNRDSICQKCYGYDLAYYENVQLGEMVGIIAAQSIGEPGTQLTMRTFHTGGVFTSKIFSKSEIFLSAKIFIPKLLMTKEYEIKDQVYLNKVTKSGSVIFMQWFGKNLKIKFNQNYYLPFSKSKICYKGDYIGEYSLPKSTTAVNKLKPFILKDDASIYNANLCLSPLIINIKKLSTIEYPYQSHVNDKRVLKTLRSYHKQLYKVANQDPAFLILKIGKILSINENFQKFLKSTANKLKASAKIKISSLNSGLINIINNTLILITPTVKYSLNIIDFIKQNSYINQTTHLYLPLQKFQFFDVHSKIIEIFLIPNFSEKIYSIKKPLKGYQKNIFISGNYKSWNTYLDLSKIFLNKDKFIQNKKPYNQLIYFNNNAIFFKKNGSFLYFQDCVKYYFPKGSIINFFTKRNIPSNSILSKSYTSTMQGNDIVQGLPKVEEIVDAVHVKSKFQACLSKHGGFVLSQDLNFLKLYSNKNERNKIVTNHVFWFDGLKNKIKPIFGDRALDKKISNILNTSIYVSQSTRLKPNLIAFDGYTFFKEYGTNFLEYYNGYDPITLWEYEEKSNKIIKKLYRSFISITKKEIKKMEKEIRKKIRKNKKLKRKPNFKVYSLKDMLNDITKYFGTDEGDYRVQKILDLLTERFSYVTTLLIVKNKIINVNLNIYISGRTVFFIQHPNFPDNIIINNNSSNGLLPIFVGYILLNLLIYPVHFKEKIDMFQYINEKFVFYICKPLVYDNLHKTLANVIVKDGNYVHLGEPLTKGRLDPHKLLSILYNYYNKHYNNQNTALYKSINKLRLIIINSLISVYEPQGVKIALKHIEIVCKQLTRKASLIQGSILNTLYIQNNFKNLILVTSPILPNEDIDLSLAMSIYNQYKNLKKNSSKLHFPIFIPILKSSINTAINRKSFLSSASFQHTKNVLIKASLLGATDWIVGLKERIILGKFIPGGTTYRQLYSTNIHKKCLYKTL